MRWLKREDDYIRLHYPKMGAKRMARLLVRSEQSVFKRARALGVKSAPNWTEEENEVLRKFYGKIPPSEIAEMIGRTTIAVESRAQRMDLFLGKRRNDS